MNAAPFTLYRVENVITEESSRRGDYASSDVTETEPASLREALAALESDCWDNIDLRGDGTIIAYPADYVQDLHTGDYSASELIIHSRRPEWSDRLLNVWETRRRAQGMRVGR